MVTIQLVTIITELLDSLELNLFIFKPLTGAFFVLWPDSNPS